MRKKRLFQILSIFIILSFGSIFIDAQQQQWRRSRVNPKYLAYVEDLKSGRIQLFTPEGYSLGDIPPIVDLSHVRVIEEKEFDMALPTSYFLGDYGRLTPIKDQGGCGSCWAFATYGSLESFLMPGESWDFAEQHLIDNHGFDLGPCSGGSTWMSTAYLARWDGPRDEADYPYIYSAPPINQQAIKKKVQQAVFLPHRSGPLDNDYLKNLVMSDGAFYISMRWDSNPLYYNPTTYAYYYNGTSGTNHGVCIVGWDDNFSASNFDITPPGDGAFIVRNSWGSWWGDNGYFYMSYYDTKLTPRTLFNNAEATTVYDAIYQYDPLGWVGDYGWDTTFYGANIFTAAGNETLNAVSFYTTDNNVDVTISIFTNVTGSTDPTNGSLATTQFESYTYPGYYTVDLDTPVALSSGQKFSVVIYFENETYNSPVPAEYPWSGYSSGASANPGESFISNTGSSWTDIGASEDSNVCIKAFTDTIPGPEIHVRGLGRNFLDGSSHNCGTRSVDFVVGREFTFTIENNGTEPLNLTGSPKVTLSGPDAAHFQVMQQPSSPVAAGGQTTFILRTVRDSVPAAIPVGWERAFSFDVNIPNNDPDENPYNFTINVTLKKY